MKVISIGTDRKIFEEDSAVRQRQVEYGRLFERVDIIVFSKRNFQFPISNFQISDNVFVYPTNSKNKLFYIIDAFLIIRKLFKNSKLKIENSRNKMVVSCQDPFETGLAGVFIKLLFNLPLHIQIHTDLAHKYFIESSLLNKIRFFMAEFVLKYSDRVRAVSERIKKSIESYSKNIDVLPIRAEVSQGQSLKIAPKDSPWESGKPFSFTLLMVCRLEKEKNIETVLKILKNLNNKDMGLCLVGDGSERNHLENMAQNMGVFEQIYFAGWQNNLSPYYKMADAFISTSFYEGYGVSTIEAASYGLPLILSDTGVAGEVFSAVGGSASGGKDQRSAFICDAKDDKCFTQSILKIYEDKELAQKMGEAAKEVAQKHLATLDDYFKKYADSILKTADNFNKKDFIRRVVDFKLTVWKSIIFVRYFICGITAAATNIGLLYIFTDLVGVWYLYSSIIAFLLALIVSFVLQKFVVFKDQNIEKIHHQFSRFFIAAVFGVLTNTILVYLCTDVLGIWYILSQIIAGFFVMIQNFILYKFFIFNEK